MIFLKRTTIFLSMMSLNLFAQNSEIRNIIDSVEIDSLMKFIRVLSGAKQATIGQDLVTLSSRSADDDGNDAAADYIQEKLESYGFTVENQHYSSSGRNVFAEQTGAADPEKKYVICAHYDTMPEGSVSPGADDNASGVAAVLEAARLFRNYDVAYTVIFAFWDEEEIEDGYIGSARFVEEYGNSISGVINIDMIGYDSDRDYSIDIHTSDWGSSVQLSDVMVDVNDTYHVDVDAHVVNPGNEESDHISFWDDEIAAIGLIEADSDFNPDYHSTDDVVDNFNEEFFLRCAKLGIGTLASLSSLTAASSVDHFSNPMPKNFGLSQNYPNPFNPTTRIQYCIPNPEMVQIKIYDILGREVRTLLNEHKNTGVYEIELDASGMSNGVYYYQIRSGYYLETKKLVFIK